MLPQPALILTNDMSPGFENRLVSSEAGEFEEKDTDTVYLDATEFYLPFNWV